VRQSLLEDMPGRVQLRSRGEGAGGVAVTYDFDGSSQLAALCERAQVPLRVGRSALRKIAASKANHGPRTFLELSHEEAKFQLVYREASSADQAALLDALPKPATTHRAASRRPERDTPQASEDRRQWALEDKYDLEKEGG